MSRRNILLFFVCSIVYQSIILKVQFYSWFPLSEKEPSADNLYPVALSQQSLIRQSELISGKNISPAIIADDVHIVPTITEIQKLSFQFPTVEQRIKYYMGSWYNHDAKFNATELCASVPRFPENAKLPQGVPLSHPFLFDATNIAAFPIPAYAKDSQKNLFDHATNLSSFQAVMRFADLHDPAAPWPQFSKSRLISNHVPRKDIVVLLKEERHYSAIKKVTNMKPTPWDNKQDILVWRGGTTGRPKEPGSRWSVVNQYFNAMDRGIDIAFNEIIEEKMLTHYQGYYAAGLVRDNVSIRELLQHKYLLSVQGNDVASGLKWMLYSNSVVLMVPPTIETFAMEGLLVPWFHYIPLKEDFSDIPEKLEWAKQHDDVCEQISKQATQFMEDLYVSDKAKEDIDAVHEGIVERYEARYSNAIGECGASKGRKFS